MTWLFMNGGRTINYSMVDGMGCSLCEKSEVTKMLMENKVYWVTYCASHPTKLMVVLKRHAKTPSALEFDLMQ